MESKKIVNATLLLIKKNKKILLGLKKRGFAKGTYNGIGGKQENGETVEQAMIRETQEEIGVTPIVYNFVGKITFDMWYKGEKQIMVMHIYTCTEYQGQITETEEMKPEWFDENNVPFDKMLPDDLQWFPLMLAGKKFIGNAVFNENMEMQSYNFKEVENIQ